MRERIKYLLLAISVGLLFWSLYKIAYVLPLEAIDVGAYQILYLHVPSFFAAFTGFFLGLAASGMYLVTGKFKYDSFAAGVNEVALMFASAGLASGMIWARYAWESGGPGTIGSPPCWCAGWFMPAICSCVSPSRSLPSARSIRPCFRSSGA